MDLDEDVLAAPTAAPPSAPGDDPIALSLSEPIPVFTEKVSTLAFRRPLAADIVACGVPVLFDPISRPPRVTHDVSRMSAMMARLSGVPASSLERLGPQEWVAAAWKLSSFFLPLTGENGVVTLSKPIVVMVDGKATDKTVSALRFRNPTAADIMRVGNPVFFGAMNDPPTIDFHAGPMTAMMARLADISVETLLTMQARDWVTAAWELSPFFIPPAETAPPAKT